ncbi:MAG: NAD(P)/FAD-dependent oxidoreductase [Leptolyngbya sp. IPPAS B-1204]
MSHILLNHTGFRGVDLQEQPSVDTNVDTVVIGAGLAGLVCAQQLQQSGHRVVVVEKSRGVGGRLATRRLQGTCADHGVRYLDEQGPLTRNLIQALWQQDILHRWTDQLYCLQAETLAVTESKPYYTATTGLTAAAKFLASGLAIRHGQRVQALTPIDDRWQISLEATAAQPTSYLTAGSVVVAVPAPQALTLVQPLLEYGFPLELVQAIQTVEFDPCYSVIATYPLERQSEIDQLPWQAISLEGATQIPDLAWLSLDSTKRPGTVPPVLVAHSTATFAQSDLEANDLRPIGQHLLAQAATLVPWLATPTEVQVHRWRYAFTRRPLQQRYLATELPLPLVCSGDWCSGKQVENAVESGLAAACQISAFLADRPLLITNWEAHAAELMSQLTATLV